MQKSRIPVGVEIMLVVGTAEFLIMVALAMWGEGWSSSFEAFIDVVALCLIVTPWLTWRLKRPAAPAPASGSLGLTSGVRGARGLNLLALGVFVAGSIASWMIASQIERQVQASAEQRLTQQVELLAGELGRRFGNDEAALKDLVGVYASTSRFDRESFRSYWSARGYLEDFPGVRGFGVMQYVPRGRAADFLARERRLQPDYALRTTGDSPDMYVITAVEPLERNRPALGYDIASEPVRRAAAEKAFKSGRPTLTGVISLVQDQRSRAGFLMLAPLYRGGRLPDPDERWSQRDGFVYSAIVAEELLAPLASLTLGQTDLVVEALDGGGQPVVIFDSQAAAAPASPAGHKPLYERRVTQDVVGLPVTLTVRSTPAFETSLNLREATLAGLGGTLLSALVALAFWLVSEGRRRAEVLARQLAGEARQLATITQRTSDAVVLCDPQGLITWVNESFTRVTGYTLAEVVGKKPGTVLQCPETDPETIARISYSVRLRQSCHAEILNQAKDGRRYWLELDIQPLFKEKGEFEGFMAVERDVTQAREQHERERHQTERLNDALRDVEALMATINAHAIVSESGRDGRITRVNDAFCRVSGYTAMELIGQDHRIVNSGVHGREFWLDMWRTVTAGRPWRGQVCNRRKDGTNYWVDSIVAPFRDGQGRIDRYVSIRFDISEAKRAQEALALERARLQNILEGTQVGTWRVNVRTGENQIDERWASMLGYRLDELVPIRPELWHGLLHPDDEIMAQHRLRDYLEGRTEIYEVERRLRHKSGRWVWILVRGTATVRQPDGKIEWMSGTHMDVTERHQLYEQIEQRSQLMAAILENMPGGLCAFDADLRLTVKNQKFVDKIGLPPAMLSEANLHIDDLVRPDADADAGADAGALNGDEAAKSVVARAVLAAQRGDVAPFELTRENGQVLEIRVNRMKGGGIVMTILDITRRKLAEADARSSEEMLRQAIDVLDEAFVIYDAQDRLLLCNQRYLDIYAVSSPVIKPGTSFEDLIRYGAERGEYAAAVGRVDEWVADRLATHLRGDTDLVQELGNGRFMRVVERKTADGLIVGFRIDITDLITARNSAQEASRASQQAMARLQAIYDVVPVGLTLGDEQGHLMDSNPAAERLLGIERGMTGAPLRLGADWITLREDGSALREEELPGSVALRERRPVRDMLLQVVTPDDRIWLSASATPVSGEGLGVVAAYVDVTRERRQQQALLEAKQGAEEASRSKSQFLANMSHEIRTPMNAILGMLQLLQGTELSLPQQDYVDKTRNAARSLLGLLNDILDFSKVEAGKMTIEAAPFQLEELLRDLSVILASSAGAKPVEVLFDVDPRVPGLLIGDSLRLKQILINLGGNAIKFTGEGLVVLRVAIMARQPGRISLEFSVRDTGIGIAPENLKRIFEGFSQAEASTTRRYGGTGLGLAISSRLVGLMGGQLRVESEVGQGSRFFFGVGLPIADESVRLVSAPEADDDRRLELLIVDDEARTRDVLRVMVESLGWRAMVASGGEEALALVDQRLQQGNLAFDAALIDGQMPGLSGWETGLRLRALVPDRRAAIVVMVTAQGREILARRPPQEQSLLDGFIVKPLSPSMVIKTVLDVRHGVGRDGTPLPRRHEFARRLAGMRVLVVEDNPINQQVAQELLQREGAVVSLADNGALGVQAIVQAEPAFDVVLMDVQMPVMDGYTATRKVRGELGQTQLPIVAMTANASERDRDEALAAGMNDHVGKPFDLDALVAVLQGLVPAARRPDGGEMAGGAPHESQQDGLMPSADTLPLPAPSMHLDLPTALGRLRHDATLWKRIAQSFEGHLSGYAQELASLLQAGQQAEARRLLHTLKGTASTVGARLLAILAADAEDQLRTAGAPQGDEVQHWLTQLQDAIEQTRYELQAVLDEVLAQQQRPRHNAGDGLTPADRQALLLLLAELQNLLDAEDYAGLDAHAALRDRYAEHLSGAMDELDEAMAALDFAAAARACTDLRSMLEAGAPA